MSYYDTYLKYKDLPFENFSEAVSPQSVDVAQFLTLLSPQAEEYLEEMAQRAHNITLNNFGRTIQLYTPMYISNYCENQCDYCGFNTKNNISRKKLSLEEIEKEAAYIQSAGLKHILILTGDSRKMSPPSYIKDCIKILRKYFDSISIEVYALTEDEYKEMVHEGVDGLTIYQETYDENIYNKIHKNGPKRDYLFRLNAPLRAAKIGMRIVNIGILLGLNSWQKDAFLLGLHAKYLQDKFPDTVIGVSLPRLRPHAGDFKIPVDISDKNIAQIIMALRIFMPRLDITISTRESPEFRENLLPLGVTRMSAGSSTRVGGHMIETYNNLNLPQFEISDKRNVEEIKKMLMAKGCQPVLKDWVRI